MSDELKEKQNKQKQEKKTKLQSIRDGRRRQQTDLYVRSVLYFLSFL